MQENPHKTLENEHMKLTYTLALAILAMAAFENCLVLVYGSLSLQMCCKKSTTNRYPFDLTFTQIFLSGPQNG